MAYTYEDVVTASSKAGVQLSNDDLKLAQQYPEFGLSMVSLMRDLNGATTAEQKLLATEAAEQLRGSYSTYGNTGTAGYDAKVDSLLGQVENYGSFNYGRETDYQKALDEVANPSSFSYDMDSDPVWASYQKQYQREGQRARANTLAQASAATGGRPSSYAVAAAQQAGDYYNSQMTDMIPTLYQNAYQRYLNDLGVKQDALAALQTDRNTAYGEWTDGYNMLQTALGNYQNQSNTVYQRYLDKLNQQIQAEQLAYQKLRDSIGDDQWQQSFDYQKGRDAVADSQWQQEFDTSNAQWQQSFDYQKGRDAVSDSQWQQSFDYQKYLDQQSLAAQNASTQSANQLAAARLMAEETGDYSRLAEIYGLSESEVAALMELDGGADESEPETDYASQVAARILSGETLSNEEQIFWDGYTGTDKTNRFVTSRPTVSEARGLGIPESTYKSQVEQWLNDAAWKDLSDAEVLWLMNYYGLEF